MSVAPADGNMAGPQKAETNVTNRDIESSENSSGDLAWENIFGSNAPPRVLTVLDIVAAGFNICNSWCGLAATLFLGYVAGGPVTIIYGLILCALIITCCCLSMAELSARFPTAGGQYHWTYILAPYSIRRGASYITAMTNVFAWQAIAASICVIIPQLVLGMAFYWNPTFVPENYQSFLIYQATNLIILGYNIGILRWAHWTHTVGLIFSLLLGFSIFVACLAKASPKADNATVWSLFINDGTTGWSSGVIFMTGLTNPNFAFIGIDGAVHLAEDALNAASAVPWALIAAVGIGFATCLPFVVAMFYCISSPEGILMALPIPPIFTIFEQALRSGAGATAMTSLIVVTGFFALNATQQTSSRLTWSFARDNGLILSKQIGHIHPKLGVPVWALLLNAFVVFVMGCINLGSNLVFNAIIGTCLILMHTSIAIPIFFVMLSGRSSSFLPKKGHWNMGALGWVFNFFTVAWAGLIAVFYCFPATNPTTSGTMNYASAVLAVFAFCAAVNWFVYARKRYEGPKIDMQKLEQLTQRA